MISHLKKIKRTKFWQFIIDYFIYPIYHFVWSYIINLKAKILYFFWSLKKKSFFSLNNNDKLLAGTTNEFKLIAKKILKETSPLIEDSKKILYSKEYSEEMKKTNYTSGEIPFRMELYDKLSLSLQKEIVEFASSDKMITTASNYLRVFPILARIEVYLNIPREKSELRGAMKWHKDGFGFKNLDFFMSVTDLDESNGPFYCLEKKIHAGIFKSFDFYLKETGERNKVPLEIFDQKFKNEKIIEFKGSSGTGIFLDSFSNYHRGGFCKQNNRIMLRLCYQTHDAICERFDFKEDFYPYDKSITNENTNDIFKKYLYFKKPTFFLKIIKNILLKFYYFIEYKY